MAVTMVREMRYGDLAVKVLRDNESVGMAAADEAATIIREAVRARGAANVILATGNSQLTFLRALRKKDDVEWPAVNFFHMDEYLQLPPGHIAGFSLFLRKHFLDQIPYGRFFPVPGTPEDVEEACRGYEALLRSHPADLCCLGIGENGHLAFNDPPVADFNDPVWIKVVELEERSRKQQVGEGHFRSMDEVPAQALSLTIPALRAARHMLCIVPEARKAEAVRNAMLGPIDTSCPASILRETPHARVFLDQDSASMLD